MTDRLVEIEQRAKKRRRGMRRDDDYDQAEADVDELVAMVKACRTGQRIMAESFAELEEERFKAVAAARALRDFVASAGYDDDWCRYGGQEEIDEILTKTVWLDVEENS